MRAPVWQALPPFGVQQHCEDQRAATNAYPHSLSAPPLCDANDIAAANGDDPLFVGQVIPLAQERSPLAVQAASFFGAFTHQKNGKSWYSIASNLALNSIDAALCNRDAASTAGEWLNTDPRWFSDTFPDLTPTIPDLSDRVLDRDVSNPFDTPDSVIHPRLRKRAQTAFDLVAGSITVNGLVKFRLRLKNEKPRSPTQKERWTRVPQEAQGATVNPFLHPVLNLPPDFGRGMKLDATDAKLLKFYTVAWCAGRTLLPSSNSFLNEVTPMASTFPCIKHALLALASTYVLDYLPSQPLERKANVHYKRAVILLSQQLNQPDTFFPGREDAVLAALVLLIINDVVNWEANQAGAAVPQWLTGSRTAKKVLDLSDPGYLYQHPENVQYGNVRRFMGGKAALVDIFCAVTAPLQPPQSKCPYPWLLEGTEREVRRIDGLNGLCPRLLHTYAQITHLTERLALDPSTIVIPKAAKVLEGRLKDFWQWSEFSEGYRTTEDLLESCILEEDTGQVSDPLKVIELTAECYVLSAQLYLQCRLFRKPRRDAVVQKTNQKLLKCIDYMPTSGPTYTAMVPLFSIWVSATVAIDPRDRAIIRKYYTTALKRTRGTGPPARDATYKVWEWQDTILAREEELDGDIKRDPDAGAEISIGQKRAWWEEMVSVVKAHTGILNLM